MKKNWNKEEIENWINSTVQEPSSRFQKESDDWLRKIRSRSASDTRSHYWKKILAISVPLTVCVTFALVFSTKMGLQKKEFTGPDHLKLQDIAEYEELVQMDERLEAGSILLDEDQWEILKVLSTLPDLGDAFAMVSYPNNF